MRKVIGLKNTFFGLYKLSSSIQYVEKKDLSESQISSSIILTTDGEGNTTRVVLDEKKENALVYYEEIPKPIHLPKLSDLSKEIE